MHKEKERSFRAIFLKAYHASEAFLRNEDGQAFAYFVVAMPVFFGVTLISVDIGRSNNLQYDLQKAVDSLALAAAAELDGSPSAITRANAALDGELLNRTRFSDDGPTRLGLDRENITVTYLSHLPLDDDDPIQDTMITTDPFRAEFAWVRAVRDDAQTYSTLFPVNFVTANQAVQVQAEAVAGFVAGVCDTPPVFMCNPFETDPDVSIYDVLPHSGHSLAGVMLELRMKGGSNQPFPGNFGFLSAGGGASSLGEAIATANTSGCYRKNRMVETEPGDMTGLNHAINVRFGRYKGSYNANDPKYFPALNVRSGYYPNCQVNPEVGTPENGFMALGRDTAFTALQGGNIGNALWDFETYWNINHPNWNGSYPNGWSNLDPPSRYDVYRYEIDPNGDGLTVDTIVTDESLGPDGLPGGGDGEVGNPQCHDSRTVTPSDHPDRRLLRALVVDCAACAASDDPSVCQGGRTLLPIRTYADLFITEAVEQKKNGTQTISSDILRVELVDLPGPEGVGSLDATSRNEAVLYR